MLHLDCSPNAVQNLRRENVIVSDDFKSAPVTARRPVPLQLACRRCSRHGCASGRDWEEWDARPYSRRTLEHASFSLHGSSHPTRCSCGRSIAVQAAKSQRRGRCVTAAQDGAPALGFSPPSSWALSGPRPAGVHASARALARHHT